MPPGPQARRGRDLPGLQPGVLAERALQADESGPRARRCAGPAEVQHWRIPPAAQGISRGPDRARAISGQVAAARRLEGYGLQRRVRRHFQHAAAFAGSPVRLASPRVLPQVTITFAKAHAYGNDFIYIRADDVGLTSAADLARELCDRHTGVGGDGLILYTPTADGASMRLFNADGSRSEVSGNGVRGLGALLLRDGPRADLTIDTEGGVKRLEWVGRDGGRYTLPAAIGPPEGLRPVPVAD